LYKIEKRMKKQLTWLLAFLGFMGITACEKTTALTAAEEDALIKAFIAKKGWTAQATPEGIYYVTDVPGTGTATPAPTNIVKVFYKGYLLDETVFDSNLAPSPAIEFTLNRVIAGWTIGFQKFKTGSKGKLLIPSHQAYGASGQGSIAGYSPLVFEIELVSFR
jgi:FKBP-type peptidyl-prolyl cis-trans isomerase FkpA